MTDLYCWQQVHTDTPGSFGVVLTQEGETVVPPIGLDMAKRITAALNATRNVPLDHLVQIELTKEDTPCAQ